MSHSAGRPPKDLPGKEIPAPADPDNTPNPAEMPPPAKPDNTPPPQEIPAQDDEDEDPFDEGNFPV